MKEVLLAGGQTALVNDEHIAAVVGCPWRVDANGYAVFKSGERLTYMHRLVMSAGADQLVDHINGNRLDNRTANLRICTHAENMRNRKVSKSNKLGLKGVYKQQNSYRAEIKVSGKKIRLGSFQSPQEAHAAYVAAAAVHHGAFANPGGSP